MKRRGFTVLELSVTLVIIGLIVSAVLAGKSLIENSKVNTFITELNKYKSAYTSFKDKYGKPPGDFDHAFQIWGTNCSTSEYLGNVSLCNGGGDGYIYYLITAQDGTSYPTADENRFAWKHLQLAGLVEQSFQIFSSDTSHNPFVPGTDSPVSAAFSAVGFNFDGYRDYCTSFSTTKWPTPFYPQLGNVINFGQTDNSSNCYLVQAGLTSQQMLSIDIKMDDGKLISTGATGAITGKFRAADAKVVATGSCAAAATGIYNTTNTDLACIGSYWVQD
ncbi:MAG: type II secretion system protein [Rickettsiales bacterium]